MSNREEHITFVMNYCQHYGRGAGTEMVCAKGVDLSQVKRVATGAKSIKWGPCIEGHLLADPHSHCPHWLRATREQGEKRADQIDAALKRMLLVTPVVSAWRSRPPIGKAEVIECPACKGRLHLSQSSYNGHVHGKCETQNCVAWME